MEYDGIITVAIRLPISCLYVIQIEITHGPDLIGDLKKDWALLEVI